MGGGPAGKKPARQTLQIFMPSRVGIKMQMSHGLNVANAMELRPRTWAMRLRSLLIARVTTSTKASQPPTPPPFRSPFTCRVIRLASCSIRLAASVELQMCQLSTFWLPNGISVSPLHTHTHTHSLPTIRQTSLVFFFVVVVFVVLPFVAISWALFLFFVCN